MLNPKIDSLILELSDLHDEELTYLARRVFEEMADRNEIDGFSIANRAAVARMNTDQLNRLCEYAAAEQARRAW